MEPTQSGQNEENLLEDIQFEYQFEKASVGQRVANYLIDLIVFYLFVFLVFVFIGLLFTDEQTLIDTLEGISPVMNRIFSVVLYGFFMGIYEGLLKGRTVGKFITKTKAIQEDGRNITWKDAMWRGLSRIVPFEPFSAFNGNPWHDRWTKTRVVKFR